MARQVAEKAEDVKPIFLNGLFSVSATSRKPLLVIRVDIIRVLKQLGVEFTGFEAALAVNTQTTRASKKPDWVTS